MIVQTCNETQEHALAAKRTHFHPRSHEDRLCNGISRPSVFSSLGAVAAIWQKHACFRLLTIWKLLAISRRACCNDFLLISAVWPDPAAVQHCCWLTCDGLVLHSSLFDPFFLDSEALIEQEGRLQAGLLHVLGHILPAADVSNLCVIKQQPLIQLLAQHVRLQNIIDQSASAYSRF